MKIIYIIVVLLGLCFSGGHSQTGCSGPFSNLKTIVEDCEVNVGTCSMKPCLQCISVERQCCGPVFKRYIAQCSGSATPYSKVKECKCLSCEQPLHVYYISGIIQSCGSNCESLKIKLGNQIITNVDATGKFAFSTDYPKNNRVVFVIIDDSKRNFPRSIVIETRRDKRTYFLSTIWIESGKTIPPFLSSMGASIVPINGVTFILKGSSFTTEEGALYNGEVTGKFNFIEPKQTGNIPAPLLAEPEDGADPGILSSSGMIQLIITTPSGESLNAKVTVQLDTTDLSPDENAGLGIWILDLETGYWKLLRSVTPATSTTRRKKRRTVDKLQSEFDIRANAIQIWNLDALVAPYCSTKVRTFLNSVDETKQLSNVLTKTYYFGIDSSEANYIERETNANGACVPIQCNAKILVENEISIISDWSHRAVDINLPSSYDSLFTVASSFFHRIEMKTDSSAVKLNGPIYKSFSECNNASFTDHFFGFIIEEPDNALVETNAIDINEENITSPWIEDVFSWWPNRTTFQACYLKIRVEGSSGLHTFKIRSIGGTHSITQGGEYGTRSVSRFSGSSCVEYKCPGTLSDGENDRTKIVVTVSNANNDEFRLTKVESMLYSSSEYSSILNQISVNSLNFDAFVPNIESAYGFGVYIDENIRPSLAKGGGLFACTSSSTAGVTFHGVNITSPEAK